MQAVHEPKGEKCNRVGCPHLVPGGPQRHMEHSPVLGEVDLLAIEHGIDLLPELGAVRQVGQQLHVRAGVKLLMEHGINSLSELCAVRQSGRQLHRREQESHC